MADAVDSKSTVRKGVRVRIPPRAHTVLNVQAGQKRCEWNPMKGHSWPQLVDGPFGFRILSFCNIVTYTEKATTQWVPALRAGPARCHRSVA